MLAHNNVIKCIVWGITGLLVSIWALRDIYLFLNLFLKYIIILLIQIYNRLQHEIIRIPNSLLDLHTWYIIINKTHIYSIHSCSMYTGEATGSWYEML